METRNMQCHFFMTEREMSSLDAAVKRSGITRSSYLRQLINGLVPSDKPPPDYYAMMRELHSIGNNLNQIARHAHASGVVDEARYDRNIAILDAALKTITEAVVLPRKRK